MAVEASFFSPLEGAIPKSVRDIPKTRLSVEYEILNLFLGPVIGSDGEVQAPFQPEIGKEGSYRILRVNAVTALLLLTQIYSPTPATFMATNLVAATSLPVFLTYLSAKVSSFALNHVLFEGIALCANAIEKPIPILQDRKIEALALGIIFYLTYQATCLLLNFAKTLGDQYDQDWTQKWDSTVLLEKGLQKIQDLYQKAFSPAFSR